MAPSIEIQNTIITSLERQTGNKESTKHGLTRYVPIVNSLIQVFPGDLLQPNYTDPDNPDRLVGRSEVGRRKAYFDQLEDILPGGGKHRLIQVIKDCLRNVPSQRPTADQLVTILEGMKGDIEGPCGELATVDAVRQVKTARTLKKEKDQLAAKDQEIQQLQQRLEVCTCGPVCRNGYMVQGRHQRSFLSTSAH